jgi:hypothetical protein
MKLNACCPRHRDVLIPRGDERTGKVTPFLVRLSASGTATRNPAFPRHSHIHVQHRMPEPLLHQSAFDHAIVVSSMRLEKPHSLSYHEHTFTNVPSMTLVMVAS